MNDPKVQTTEFANCGPVCRYRLLIGWMAGTESDEDATGIKVPDDLLTGQCAMNEYQFELPVMLEMLAWHVGSGYAFLDDYTATNTMNRLQKLVKGEWHDVMPDRCKVSVTTLPAMSLPLQHVQVLGKS